MHNNIRSLKNKIEDLQFLFQQLPVEILADKETWLTHNDLVQIPDYNFVQKLRETGNEGICFCVKKSINYQVIECKFNINTFE